MARQLELGIGAGNHPVDAQIERGIRAVQQRPGFGGHLCRGSGVRCSAMIRVTAARGSSAQSTPLAVFSAPSESDEGDFRRGGIGGQRDLFHFDRGGGHTDLSAAHRCRSDEVGIGRTGGKGGDQGKANTVVFMSSSHDQGIGVALDRAGKLANHLRG
ncbi:MAG: hypothetical protein IPL38_15550 [Rhodobacter sp.]|nr:hypothetical protein [Rhodobacter sp.]